MRYKVPGYLSIFLDVIRCGLALVVVIGHSTQSFFQTAFPDLTVYAVYAVGGFFVLSGFTIRMLSPHAANFDLKPYMVDRVSRLWSVAIPALVLTVVCDGLAWSLNPEYYLTNWWGADGSIFKSAIKILLNVLLVAQSWGMNLAPLSNSPFWSLSYEFGFYVFYGCWLGFSQSRLRIPITLGLALLFGPHIVLMMFFWLLGVILYEYYQRLPLHRIKILYAHLVAQTGFLMLTILVFANENAREGISKIVGPFIDGLFFTISDVVNHDIGSARIDLWLIIGCLLFVPFFAWVLVVARTLEGLKRDAPGGAVKFGRKLGEFTFPLYLFHFPLLVVAGASGLLDPESVYTSPILVVLVFCIVMPLVPATDKIKRHFRVALLEIYSWVETVVKKVSPSKIRTTSTPD